MLARHFVQVLHVVYLSFETPSLKFLSLLLFMTVALYAISAVYFAGVMVRLMLTLTPVVCMLSAVAFSSVFEHYLGDDLKRQSPPAEDSSDEDDRKNAGNLYDKVGVSPAISEQTPSLST